MEETSAIDFCEQVTDMKSRIPLRSSTGFKTLYDKTTISNKQDWTLSNSYKDNNNYEIERWATIVRTKTRYEYVFTNLDDLATRQTNDENINTLKWSMQ